MRIPKVESFVNASEIILKHIDEVPKFRRSTVLLTEKDRVKFIKSIESVVRLSYEYRDYIKFLKDIIDMRQCSFFNNVNNRDDKKVSIHIHHEPFTLYDIVQIVLNKHISDEIDLNPLLIAEEVTKLHYKNLVGLIPVSETVHELVHDGKLFIPLQSVKGRYISFLEEYDDYIADDLKSMLEQKYLMSKELDVLDLSILEKKYVYLEIDGMTFPQPLERSA